MKDNTCSRWPKYEGLVADLKDGYIVRFCSVEVGARGLVFKSVYNVLKGLRNRAMKGLNEVAEKVSCWL